MGPIGGSPLSWLLLVAALFPLLVGTGPRFAWAARLWTVAVLSWALALVVERGWSGSFAPSVDVVLAPAAVAIAACVGLGVSAFETDLAGHRFGWRQAATVVMVAAVAVGVVPVVAEVGNGRWGVAPSGFEIPLSYLNAGANEGPFRVLWLGDPRTLPLGGWSAGRGLAYATSEDGLPNAQDLFAPAAPGPAATLAAALVLARADDTVHLGRLLAPAAVRFVVVLDTAAPSVPGVQPAPAYPPPPGLIGALNAQIDLRQIPGGEGFTVFENTAALPGRAERGPTYPPLPSGPVSPSVLDVANWRAVLPGPAGALAATGAVSAGTVFSSAAPAGHFQLIVDGRPVAGQPAFGWASQYRAPAGTAVLRFGGTRSSRSRSWPSSSCGWAWPGCCSTPASASAGGCAVGAAWSAGIPPVGPGPPGRRGAARRAAPAAVRGAAVSPRPLRPTMQISLVIGLVLLLVGVGFVDRALPHTDRCGGRDAGRSRRWRPPTSSPPPGIAPAAPAPPGPPRWRRSTS